MKTLASLSVLVCAIPALAASNWRPAGPYGGTATAIAIDPTNPSTMYVGARNSLIFRSTDRGESWTRLPFPRHFLGTVSALAVDPSDPKRVYAALSAENSHYGSIWRSKDAGESWQMSEDLAGTSGEALALWPKDPKVVVAGTRQGVWMSRDGGDSWARISQPWNHEMRVITALAIDPENASVIYAGTPHLPWKTEDGGKNWKSIHAGMVDDTDVFSIFIDPAAPTNLLASACSGIYRSESNGENWTKFKGIPASQRRTHVIRLHPKKPNVIYAGTTVGLLRSVDGGSTFKALNQLHILSMVFDPENSDRIYLATEGTGLWRSADGGETVEPWNQGFVNRKVLDITSAGEMLFANTIQDGEGGGVYRSADGGRNWEIAAGTRTLGDNHIHHVAGHPSDPQILFAANQRKLLRSVDGGKNWNTVALPGRGKPLRVTALEVFEQKSLVLFLGTDQGLYKSEDLGANWREVALTKFNLKPAVLGLTMALPRIVARTQNALYLSDESGDTWRPLNLLMPTALVYDIAVPPGLTEPLLLATAKGLIRSDNGGKTWEEKTSGLQDGTVSSVRYQSGVPGLVWAVQFGKLYKSEDYGMSWAGVEGGEIPESTIRALWTDAKQPFRLFAITPDLGMFYLETKDFQMHNMEKAGTP